MWRTENLLIKGRYLTTNRDNVTYHSLRHLLWVLIRSASPSTHNICIYRELKELSQNYHKPLLITKTCIYNFDPLKPRFYLVKLRLTGYTLSCFFLVINIDCAYLSEPPRRGGSNEYPQYMFWAKIWKKNQDFYLKIFIWCW